MSDATSTVKVKVSPQVARIVGKGAPRQLQLEAARGAHPLDGPDYVTLLFYLRHSKDQEIRSCAVKTLFNLPSKLILPVVADPGTHPKILDLISQVKIKDLSVIAPLVKNPSLMPESLHRLASRCDGDVLHFLIQNKSSFSAASGFLEALATNPGAPSQPEEASRDEVSSQRASEEPKQENVSEDSEEKENLSKYQQALEMGVSEKIKMALTGDKEWRGIFMKDPNKLVSGAVMKNPRITDAEVLSIAKNKSSNEEMIRLITLNKDWIKNYEMKKALVMHPKTPLPKALRFMNVLGEKDLKNIASSKGVSQVLTNNARRLLMAKDKK